MILWISLWRNGDFMDFTQWRNGDFMGFNHGEMVISWISLTKKGGFMGFNEILPNKAAVIS